MMKLDLRPTLLKYPAPSDVALESVRRLIVLVPSDINPSIATRQIWEVASTARINVLLLGLCRDTAEEPGLRRELITMASLLHDGKIAMEVKVDIGTNWLNIVKTYCRADDMIICFAEQRDELLHKPLNQTLEENLDAPIFIISGLYPQGSSRLNMLSFFLLWAGLIGIIAGAFLLQIRIMSLPRDWSQTTLMILSTIAEFSLIWAWNNLFS
jgi:hypothetical protein